MVSAYCSLLVCDLVTYLSLVLEDDLSFGESGSCKSGANLFSSRIPVSWVGLLLLFVFATVHGCFLLGTGVEETLLCDSSAGHSVSSRVSGCWVLHVNRLPISKGSDDLFFGFAPREFQGGLLVDLLP